MGFMDKMKDAAKQAGTGAKQVGEAAKEGMSPSTSADHYKQNIGGEIKVKIDPADPNKMVLWG